MNNKEYVILVDEQDNEIGLMEKHEAHQKALLHRAISVFVFNNKGELLIQQRAEGKYHSGGLWTNTCCSHPRQHETTLEAAHRRLNEEMGFDCELTERFSFVYRSAYENGLSEHELDFVFSGTFNGTPEINKKEVACFQWISLENLQEEMHFNPLKYTSWFHIIFDKYMVHLIP